MIKTSIRKSLRASKWAVWFFTCLGAIVCVLLFTGNIQAELSFDDGTAINPYLLVVFLIFIATLITFVLACLLNTLIFILRHAYKQLTTKSAEKNHD